MSSLSQSERRKTRGGRRVGFLLQPNRRWTFGLACKTQETKLWRKEGDVTADKGGRVIGPKPTRVEETSSGKTGNGKQATAIRTLTTITRPGSEESEMRAEVSDPEWNLE